MQESLDRVHRHRRLRVGRRAGLPVVFRGGRDGRDRRRCGARPFGGRIGHGRGRRRREFPGQLELPDSRLEVVELIPDGGRRGGRQGRFGAIQAGPVGLASRALRHIGRANGASRAGQIGVSVGADIGDGGSKVCVGVRRFGRGLAIEPAARQANRGSRARKVAEPAVLIRGGIGEGRRVLQRAALGLVLGEGTASR